MARHAYLIQESGTITPPEQASTGKVNMVYQEFVKSQGVAVLAIQLEKRNMEDEGTALERAH